MPWSPVSHHQGKVSGSGIHAQFQCPDTDRRPASASCMVTASRAATSPLFLYLIVGVACVAANGKRDPGWDRRIRPKRVDDQLACLLLRRNATPIAKLNTLRGGFASGFRHIWMAEQEEEGGARVGARGRRRERRRLLFPRRGTARDGEPRTRLIRWSGFR